MINSKLIVTLLVIVILLLILHILMNKKRETFQNNTNKNKNNKNNNSDENSNENSNENSSNNSNNNSNNISNDTGFSNTYDFVEYSRNSEKLMDMFKALEEAEKKCSDLEDFAYQKEEKETMRDNDKAFKELQEQDKKIDELKEIIKYLTIEKKRREKINNRCRNNKQVKLNKQYDIVRKLNNDGLVNNNSINLDLNVSNSEAIKNMLNVSKEKKRASDVKKCRHKGKDFVNLDAKDIGKCSGCSAEKLEEQEPYILKDFS